jgi:hypothetical protein
LTISNFDSSTNKNRLDSSKSEEDLKQVNSSSYKQPICHTLGKRKSSDVDISNALDQHVVRKSNSSLKREPTVEELLQRLDNKDKEIVTLKNTNSFLNNKLSILKSAYDILFEKNVKLEGERENLPKELALELLNWYYYIFYTSNYYLFLVLFCRTIMLIN